MQDERINRIKQTQAMRKRRETMADGRRYIIYYTFENLEESPLETAQNKAEIVKESENV